MAGNFWGRKLSRIGKKWKFCGENFHGMLNHNHRWVQHAQNFMEKTFAGGFQTAKFVNVFSLESFPLYSRSLHLKQWHLGTWLRRVGVNPHKQLHCFKLVGYHIFTIESVYCKSKRLFIPTYGNPHRVQSTYPGNLYNTLYSKSIETGPLTAIPLYSSYNNNGMISLHTMPSVVSGASNDLRNSSNTCFSVHFPLLNLGCFLAS